MSTFVFANNVKTTLAATLPSNSVYITLASSQNLPSLSVGQMMPITLNDAATGQVFEICYVTAISGTTLTVIRGQEGTGALAWGIGDFAFVGPTAGTLAPVNGNPANLFDVAAGVNQTNAINFGQAIATFASLNGSLSNRFNVANATQPYNAINLSQAMATFLTSSSVRFNTNNIGSVSIPAGQFNFIINWGVAPIYDDSYSAVTFANVFPTKILGAYATAICNTAVTGSNAVSAFVGGLTLTGMNVGVSVTDLTPVGGAYWLAIGY